MGGDAFKFSTINVCFQEDANATSMVGHFALERVEYLMVQMSRQPNMKVEFVKEVPMTTSSNELGKFDLFRSPEVPWFDDMFQL